jgi:hypothetical protein
MFDYKRGHYMPHELAVIVFRVDAGFADIASPIGREQGVDAC